MRELLKKNVDGSISEESIVGDQRVTFKSSILKPYRWVPWLNQA